jgi:hypothetical protein
MYGRRSIQADLLNKKNNLKNELLMNNNRSDNDAEDANYDNKLIVLINR